jgi:hypothetical protein
MFCVPSVPGGDRNGDRISEFYRASRMYVEGLVSL